MVDTEPSEPKALVELKAKRTVDRAAAPETAEDRVTAAYGNEDAVDARHGAGGAAAAAGVLTAVDEDEEGAEGAEVPRDFDYFSDEDEGAE